MPCAIPPPRTAKRHNFIKKKSCRPGRRPPVAFPQARHGRRCVLGSPRRATMSNVTAAGSSCSTKTAVLLLARSHRHDEDGGAAPGTRSSARRGRRRCSWLVSASDAARTAMKTTALHLARVRGREDGGVLLKGGVHLARGRGREDGGVLLKDGAASGAAPPRDGALCHGARGRLACSAAGACSPPPSPCLEAASWERRLLPSRLCHSLVDARTRWWWMHARGWIREGVVTGR